MDDNVRGHDRPNVGRHHAYAVLRYSLGQPATAGGVMLDGGVDAVGKEFARSLV
jgi:hypothetical protein